MESTMHFEVQVGTELRGTMFPGHLFVVPGVLGESLPGLGEAGEVREIIDFGASRYCGAVANMAEVLAHLGSGISGFEVFNFTQGVSAQMEYPSTSGRVRYATESEQDPWGTMTSGMLATIVPVDEIPRMLAGARSLQPLARKVLEWRLQHDGS